MSKRPGGNVDNHKNDKKRKWTAGGAPRANDLQPGIRGCLITCDIHAEKDAIKETFRLLEALTEDASAPAPASGTAAASSSSAAADDAGTSTNATAGDALQAELRALQQDGGEKGKKQQPAAPAKPFSVAQTGCNGKIFIKFSNAVELGPVALVNKVFERARDGGVAGGRAPHVIRMLPVALTCPSSADITAAVTPLMGAPPAGAGLAGFAGSYRVEWQRRCNSDIDKIKVINALASAVQEAAPKASVDLSNAECAVVAEVIKTTCCLSVLPRWREFCGYNFRRFTGGEVPVCEAKSKEKQQQNQQGSGGGGDGEAAPPAK